MELSEKLTQIKSETESLLAYANEVTGEEDTTLGDALLTLASAYGTGGERLLDFLPGDAELIGSSCLEWNLSNDTNFDSITPNTTSQTVRTVGGVSQNTAWLYVPYPFSGEHENDEVMAIAKVFCNPVYKDGAESKPRGKQFRYFGVCFGAKNDGVFTSFIQSKPYVIYEKANGTIGFRDTSEGIYFLLTSMSLTESYFRIPFPAVLVKAHDTYATVDSLSEIDSENTKIYGKVNVYRYKKGIWRHIAQ